MSIAFLEHARRAEQYSAVNRPHSMHNRDELQTEAALR